MPGAAFQSKASLGRDMSRETHHVDLLAPPSQTAIDEAVRSFADTLRERFGARLSAIHLFGSRTRGDFRPYSDVDIAVVIGDEDAGSFSTTKALSDLAYDVFLDTGAKIEVWPFTEVEWNDPRRSLSPSLVESVRRDGRLIWRKE
jgi:predicted nucleotidyltransferase